MRSALRWLLTWGYGSIGAGLLVSAVIALARHDISSALGWLRWVVLLGGLAVSNVYYFREKRVV